LSTGTIVGGRRFWYAVAGGSRIGAQSRLGCAASIRGVGSLAQGLAYR
jgi:hypothetical protein